ncbi:Signal recognition particle SEC65 subunit [Acrodontium crateriforme]|uniref:Signal recognition particle SEC65 subunit n=1 Tax=Acrodontium crateriforme TaxID=150365 RepID=A0AAQ3MD65_9PEZI|nr:Signal recognition particle SEC65 subunit [Acrodontium crateriforme]
MANPRIEEISDDEIDDPEEMDLDAFDFARPQKGGLQPSMDPAASQMNPSELQALLSGGAPPSGNFPPQPRSNADRERIMREQQQKSKEFQCIYPVYFDATRSREQGRRVSKEDAVKNPLAREIVDALQYIGGKHNIPFQVMLEPAKTHPKDWANPGRVKVLVKKDGEPISPKVQNKHHLYKMIAEFLRANPTTEDSPMRLRIQGMPMPKEKIPPPAVPRGFKIGNILPLHSPALSGGGVSENFLKDMMSEMGGQLPPGMEGMAGLMGAGGAGPSAPSKPKKTVIRAKK